MTYELVLKKPWMCAGCGRQIRRGESATVCVGAQASVKEEGDWDAVDLRKGGELYHIDAPHTVLALPDVGLRVSEAPCSLALRQAGPLARGAQPLDEARVLF